MIPFTTAPFKQSVFPWQPELASAYIFFSLSLSLPMCHQLTRWSSSIVVYAAAWRLSCNVLAANSIVNCNSFAYKKLVGWFLKQPKSPSGLWQQMMQRKEGEIIGERITSSSCLLSPILALPPGQDKPGKWSHSLLTENQLRARLQGSSVGDTSIKHMPGYV